MALQTSGAISLGDIQTEFGGTNPISISEYYGAASGVPASGTISISNFYGTSSIVIYTASNATNLDAGTAFGSAWTQAVAKELVIPSGVVIGSSTPSSPAITLPSGMGGSLIIKNSGSIHGAGGASNGGTGGDAILAQSAVTIQNNGVIYAGGGGGGQGGNGQYVAASYAYCKRGSNEDNCPSCTSNCNAGYTASCGACTQGGGTCLGTFIGDAFRIIYCTLYATSIGGNGGVGQGYNQAAGTGAAGGTNAGTGGNGGAFGASGLAGSNGNLTAGLPGGLAGYYVNGIANATFSVLGTVAGRTV